mgnify:CR=1 FL=1
MIKNYKCQYPNCEKMSKIRSKVKNKDSEYYGLSVCNYHANLLRDLKQKSDQTRRTEKARAEQRKDYPEFYQKWCEIASRTVCNECGDKLKGLSTEVCHIIMKSTNNELAVLDDNIILLCEKCHSLFDKSLESRSEMKCFPQSLEQYKLIQKKVEIYSSEVRFYEELI